MVVYEDPNYNHKLDAGEQSVVTDAQGNYTFTNPPADPEILRIVLPNGDQQTFPAGGAGNYVGKNTGHDISGENFGIYSPTAPAVTISGTVFNDTNGDGIQDNGETGLAGVTVYEDPNYNHKPDPGEQSVVTDASGHYTFTNLPANPQIIRIVLPSGAQQTLPANGAGIYVGKNITQSISGANFGVYTPSAQGGRIVGNVFNDLNGDHAYESATEPLLAGVTVVLDLNGDFKLDAGDLTTVTDSHGNYAFNGLAPHVYQIFIIPPAGFRQTDPDPSNPIDAARDVDVTANATNTVDPFGVTTTAYVGGTLFNDLNGNGAQDSGEPPLAGWKVYIDLNNDGIDEPNEPTAVTTTTSTGYWYFRAVAPGTYTIRAVAPSGWTITPPYAVTLTSGEKR